MTTVGLLVQAQLADALRHAEAAADVAEARAEETQAARDAMWKSEVERHRGAYEASKVRTVAAVR